jgi:NAD(P)-dependent dehydrogenase (short-subunit alcohol dehydrogenase family)
MAVSLKHAATHAHFNDRRIIMKSVILATGAGTGIGKLSALALAEAGHVVYATMRDVEGRNRGRADELRAVSAEKGITLIPLELDVLSQDSADVAAASIVREQGRIDVVMQNAGHLVVGPSEAFTPEEMMKVFDTNLFGAQRVNRAVLPYMRKQESGLVLWISSTTTKGGFPPFMGPYGAAKAAMDSLAVTLAYELARFGVETSIVVPGAFTSGTDHFPSAGKPADSARAEAYARYDGVMDQIGGRLTSLTPPDADPKAVADEVVRIVGLAKGTRPMRSVIDFVGDGAAQVLEVSERVRIEFAKRIGMGDLLEAKVSR